MALSKGVPVEGNPASLAVKCKPVVTAGAVEVAIGLDVATVVGLADWPVDEVL